MPSKPKVPHSVLGKFKNWLWQTPIYAFEGVWGLDILGSRLRVASKGVLHFRDSHNGT